MQLAAYFGATSTLWGTIGSLSVVGTVPVFVMVALFQKFMVRSISMGAVKE